MSRTTRPRSAPPRRRRSASRRPPSRRTAPAWSVVLAGAAVVVGVVAVVVAFSGGDDTTPGPIDAAGDPGVSHVHGLGINPADGSLIIATHNGSFRLPPDGDGAERIGDSFQDTMGFTVAAPDHFLGSGHPDLVSMRQGQPTRLGLIESTDAGASWTSLSLSGEVDFHGLAFVHDLVYGWDSGTGRFMVSADRREWETRSTLDLLAFAVDPDDPEYLVAATPNGVAESTDGGRTWAGDDGPQLVALSWDADAGLFGAGSDGSAWQHVATGWEALGPLPGEPQALLATPDALYAAAHDNQQVTGIYLSTDGGRTWQLRYRDSGA